MALTLVQGLIHLVFALFIGQSVLVKDPAAAPLTTAEPAARHLRHDLVFVRCNVPTLVMTHWTSQRATSLTKLKLPESAWALYEAVGGVLPKSRPGPHSETQSGSACQNHDPARGRSAQRTSAASIATQRGATKRSAAGSADADDSVAHAWAAASKRRRTSRQRSGPFGGDGSAAELAANASRSRGSRTPDSFIAMMSAPPVVCEATAPPAPLPQELLDQLMAPPPPLVPRTNDDMPWQFVFVDDSDLAEWGGASMNWSLMAGLLSEDDVPGGIATADCAGEEQQDAAGGTSARAADTASAAHARALEPHPEARPERELVAARSSREAKLWEERTEDAARATERRAERRAREARAAGRRVQCAQDALLAADLASERIAVQLYASETDREAAAAELEDALEEQARADTARRAAEQQVQRIQEFGVDAASHCPALDVDVPGHGAPTATAGVLAACFVSRQDPALAQVLHVLTAARHAR